MNGTVLYRTVLNIVFSNVKIIDVLLFQPDDYVDESDSIDYIVQRKRKALTHSAEEQRKKKVLTEKSRNKNQNKYLYSSLEEKNNHKNKTQNYLKKMKLQ